MFVLVIMVIISGVAMEEGRDPVMDQLVNFKDTTDGPIGVLTTSSGAPVSYEDSTNTLNAPLAHNDFYMDTITHLTRERTIDRSVHAKGTGGFGYFEVTHNISNICKASFLNEIGKKTPIAVRFSASTFEKGTSDLILDTRGFAVKFYSEDGNFDFVGFNTPVFFFRDPLQSLTTSHAFRRNPVTNLVDFNAVWDILTLHPHLLHTFFFVISGYGCPAGYQHMPGFSIHTYQVGNKFGERSFVRFHMLPDAGIKNFSPEEIGSKGTDYDYLTKILYRAIANGEFPTWTLSVQVLTESDVIKERNRGNDIFDVTRIISEDDYPLQPVGKLVMNKNPTNVHSDIEQLAFCPSNLVPGISGGPDKLFQARRFAYRDGHTHRLGVNFNNIPVNCPFRVTTFTYNRDGVPPVNDNGKDAPNYYPNSFHGPVPYIVGNDNSNLITIIENKPNNTEQISELYTNKLTTAQRDQLVNNIVLMMQQVTKFIREKTINVLTKLSPDLGKRIVQGLNHNMEN